MCDGTTEAFVGDSSLEGAVIDAEESTAGVEAVVVESDATFPPKRTLVES